MGASISEGGVYTGYIHSVIEKINEETFKCKEGRESYFQALRFFEMADISGFNLTLSNSTFVKNHAGIVFVLDRTPSHPREESTVSFIVDPFTKNFYSRYSRVLGSLVNKTFMEKIREKRFIKEVRAIATEQRLENYVYNIDEEEGRKDKSFKGLKVFVDMPNINFIERYAKTIGTIDKIISSHYF